jgi:hypothetical protein
MEPGEAFWVKNKRGSNQVVYLMGEVPDRYTMPTNEVDVVEGMSLVSFSFPVEIAITNLNLPQAKVGNNRGAADKYYQVEC